MTTLDQRAKGVGGDGAERDRGAGNDWDHYVAAVRAQTDAECRLPAALLWVRKSEPRIRNVLSGAIVVDATEGAGHKATRDGTIHDWTGALYLPGITPGRVFSTLNATDGVPRLSGPAMIETEVVSRAPNAVRIAATSDEWTALSGYILRASYESVYVWPAPDRWWCLSRTTGVQQSAFWRLGQTKKQLAGIDGYIRSLSCATLVAGAMNGSIIEVRALLLARSAPNLMAWLVNVIVRRLCRTVIVTTLRQTRDIFSV